MKYIFAGLLALAPLATMTVLAPSAYAQTTDERRAQALYFESEAALADGQLDRAEQFRARAVSLLGSSNAKLAALEVRILFAQKRYLDAKETLDQFYRYDPGPNLIRDMAPYLVEIEEELEKRRLAKLALVERERKRKLEAAAALELKKRAKHLVATCSDEASCITALAELDASKAKVLSEYQEIEVKLCAEFRHTSSCEQLLRNQSPTARGQNAFEAPREYLNWRYIRNIATGVLCINDYSSDSISKLGDGLTNDNLCQSAMIRMEIRSSYTENMLDMIPYRPQYLGLSQEVADKVCNDGNLIGCRYLKNIYFDDKYGFKGNSEKFVHRLGIYCKTMWLTGVEFIKPGKTDTKKYCRKNGFGKP